VRTWLKNMIGGQLGVDMPMAAGDDGLSATT